MALPQGSKAFKEKAGDKVKSFNIEKVTQFDFYDKEEPVSKAVKKTADYMRENL